MPPGIDIANLTYDAKQELLKGIVGNALPFSMKAYSGGSRGHSAKITSQQSKLYLHSQATSMWSHFANTPTVGHGSKKDPYLQRGGTLPSGHYACHYIAHHKSFGECIRLTRNADTHLHYPSISGANLDNRGDDFYIHGHGPKGSDGCIVPELNSERLRLNQAVRDFQGKVILLVTNVAYVLPAERDDIRLA